VQQRLDHTSLVRDLRAGLSACVPSTDPFDAAYVSTKSRPDLALEAVMQLLRIGLPVHVFVSTPGDFPGIKTAARDVEIHVIGQDYEERTADMLEHRFCHEAIRSGQWDLHRKRNRAIAHAKRRDFKKILLIDDDIRQIDQAVVHNMAAALDTHAIAGCVSFGHFDNSVVGHAARAAGMPQSCFLSGNCLGLRVEEVVSTFPPIYNEDWLFMFEHVRRGEVAIAGLVEQLPPRNKDLEFAAVFEEPGEILAEGMYSSLHEPESDVSSQAFWIRYLRSRRTFIESILETLSSDDAHIALHRALAGSLAYLEQVEASECVEFVEMLAGDRAVEEDVLASA
jgi:hypothetical protein